MNHTSDNVVIISFRDMPLAEDLLLFPLIGKASLNNFIYITDYYWVFSFQKNLNQYYLKDVKILNKGIPLIKIDEPKYNEIHFKIDLGFSFLEILKEESLNTNRFITDPSQILTGEYSGANHVNN